MPLHISPEEVGTAEFAMARKRHYEQQRREKAKADADAVYAKALAYIDELAEIRSRARMTFKQRLAEAKARQAEAEAARREEEAEAAAARRRQIAEAKRTAILALEGGAGVTDIIELVAVTFNISVDDILSEKRKCCISLARSVAMYLARRHTGQSLVQLGSIFGRDHTSVLAGVRKIVGRRLDDQALNEQISDLEGLLQ